MKLISLRVIVLIAALFCLAGQCLAAAPDQVTKAADEKAAELSALINTSVNGWRCSIGEVAKAEDPKLDDSSWKKYDSDYFVWGNQPLAWIRGRVTIPKEVLGMPVDGSRVTFLCGVDDDGTIYVNGKKASDFHWDGGRAVLTEKAQPGETFDIAIRNTNSIGEGRLLFAKLQFGALDSVYEPVKQLLVDYQNAKVLYDLADKNQQEQYAANLVGAMQAIDTDSLKSGKIDIFLQSLQSASASLKKTDTLAKNFTIHLVGHAHIDMNWLWLWPETVDVCKNTFTSVTNLMNEFPDMKFGQSQPETYLVIKEKYPELYAKMKEMAKRGQWDPTTAATWVEGDTNMSSGEAIVRSILYGKRFIMKEFGVEPVVCWEPDTFGHPWTLPQILAKSGIKYYYNMRCNAPNAPVFWWQSPDGSRVLAFSYGDYNGNTDPAGMLQSAIDFSQKTGIHDFLRVYGAGDHGGGPTREMLKTAKDLQSKSGYPNVQFDTMTGYMDKVAASGKQFPSYSNELNTIFEGCYTSHSDIKRWNRDSESLLPTAEKFAAISGVYPKPGLEAAWRNTCFNEFHDILCGTAIHGSYEYSKQLYDDAAKQGKTALGNSLAALESRMNTKGKGIPVVVFNSLNWTRTDAVSVPAQSLSGEVVVTDSSGMTYPAQISAGKLHFTAHYVPALGYKVFWAGKGRVPAGCKQVDNSAMANQSFQVRIDPDAGAITAIYDKVNNRAVLPQNAKAGILQILLEKAQGMSAWNWGQILGTQDLTKGAKVSLIDAGPAKVTYAIEHSYSKSAFKQEVTLYDGVPRIDIHLTADWQEGVDGDNPIPALKAAFPVALNNPKATFEIPFGSIERERSGKEVPAQKWIDLSEPGYGVSLLNDCKYGFDVKDNTMRISLLRASREPDPQPDKGIHEMTYSIYPHKGDWRDAGTARRGYEINEPLIARVVQPHSGKLPALYSFVSIAESNFIVTAFKKAEDDNSHILRFYETNGQPGKATIKLNTAAKYYVETDLLERPIGKKMPVKSGKFTVSVGKNEIKTYKLLP